MYIYTEYIYSKSYVFAKNCILSYGYPARIIQLSYDFISTLYDKSSLVLLMISNPKILYILPPRRI